MKISTLERILAPILIIVWVLSPITPVFEWPDEGPFKLGVEVQMAEAFGNGYTYRRSITINESQVSGSSDHTNFPVLISFTDPTFATSGHVTDDGGDDIIFTSDSAGSSQLAHDVERYNLTTGEVTMWVEVPTLDFDTNTVIYMFYGNSSVSSPTESVLATWDTTYDGVWHMDDTNGTNVDSAGSANNGTVSGATHSAAGKFGPAYDFDGVNDLSTVTDASILDFTTAGTFESWIKTDDVSTSASLNIVWKTVATSTLGLAGTDDHSSVDSVIVGDKIYYGAALCRDGGEQLYTATSTLDGQNFSVWTSRATTTGATIGTCGDAGGMSIGVDSDGMQIWYAVLSHDAADAETFAYATSSLDLSTFSLWKQPGTAPAGASTAEQSVVDMVITGDKAYFAATMVSGTGIAFNVASTTLTGSGWKNWVVTTPEPTGSGAGEDCELGVDTDGQQLYFDSVCVANSAEVHEMSRIDLNGADHSAFAGGADPDGGGTTDFSGVDNAIVGGTSYKAFFGHSDATTAYRIASSTLPGSVATGGWADSKAASGDPDGTNTVDTTDPSIESDGKDLFYSAFAHDTTRTSFFISSTTLPAHPFVSKLGAYELIQTGKGFMFDWSGKPSTFGTTTNTTSFSHVVVTNTGTIMNYYINGALYASTTVATSTARSFDTNSNDLLFGKGFRSDGRPIWFNGIIDEVRVSSSTRSTDWIQTSYNNQNATSTFYTLGAEEEEASAPTATTNFANAGFNSATLHGTKTGGTNATEHGFAYSTDATLNTSVTTTTIGALTSNSSFLSNIGGLTQSQTYYFRAYATNGGGTGYGAILSFFTGNSTATRMLRLFEGFKIKLNNGKLQLHQR